MSSEIRKIKLYRTRVVAPAGIIRDAYGAHRLLWRAFPKHDEGSVQPFTYAEQTGGGGPTVFLMQSAVRPDFSEVLGVQAEVKEIDLEVRPGDFFYFRLRAEPTKALLPVEKYREGDPKVRGKRVPILGRQGVQEWFDRQAEHSGFKVQQLVFDIREDKVKIRSAASDKAHGFKVASAQFDGGLIVTDPLQFENALFKGVGRGRSYGFAMLLVSK